MYFPYPSVMQWLQDQSGLWWTAFSWEKLVFDKTAHFSFAFPVGHLTGYCGPLQGVQKLVSGGLLYLNCTTHQLTCMHEHDMMLYQTFYIT